MSRGGRVRRTIRATVVLPLAAVLPALLPAVTSPAQATAAARGTAAARAGDDVVQVRITDITPTAPSRSETPTPLRISLSLTNTSSEALAAVNVAAFRGEPVGNQQALDSVIADATPPTDGLKVTPTKPVTVSLPAKASTIAVFSTTISVLNEGGLCQCLDAVYPLHLVATADGTAVGSATTFVPSQLQPATKTKVAWVWPLIDRPHRLTEETVFTDDDLAASVAGGRLDRVLQVVERLGSGVPMTLVADPELLDELQVMATGRYTVRTTDGTLPGTGQAAAQAWLDRFAALLVGRPGTHVSLTPFADPDLRSLAGDDLTWVTTLPAAMARRVSLALAGRALTSDVAWPAGGALPGTALRTLAAGGGRTVVVDSSALRPATRDGIPTALAKVRTDAGTLTAVGTSPAVQRQVAEAVTAEASATAGSTVLPYLVAETTVRSVQSEDDPSYAVLTPPRYVDPDPARAVRAITATSSNPFATPVDVRTLGSEPSVRSAKMRASATTAGRSLPAANLAADAAAAEALPAITAMLGRSRDARIAVAGLAYGRQRVASSAWRPLALSPFPAATGGEYAAALSERIGTFLDGVRILTPSSGSGSYTLGSQDSSLPITVENTLPYPVSIVVGVSTRDGLPGYDQTGALGAQRIAANSKQTVQVPSRLDRSGRIPIEASLAAPSGRPLGVAVQLYVRSTVFGTIGVVITVVAGGVLAVALIVRFGRRLARLRRKAAREARSADRPGGRSGGPRTPAGSATA